ncbi:MAG: hypothetical protein WDM89_16860 [Rhizomicrobium sp.]
MTALTLRAGANGNPVPGFLLALAGSGAAFYAIQDEEPRRQIVLAWTICASGILSAYSGYQARKVWG